MLGPRCPPTTSSDSVGGGGAPSPAPHPLTPARGGLPLAAAVTAASCVMGLRQAPREACDPGRRRRSSWQFMPWGPKPTYRRVNRASQNDVAHSDSQQLQGLGAGEPGPRPLPADVKGLLPPSRLPHPQRNGSPQGGQHLPRGSQRPPQNSLGGRGGGGQAPGTHEHGVGKEGPTAARSSPRAPVPPRQLAPSLSAQPLEGRCALWAGGQGRCGGRQGRRAGFSRWAALPRTSGASVRPGLSCWGRGGPSSDSGWHRFRRREIRPWTTYI